MSLITTIIVECNGCLADMERAAKGLELGTAEFADHVRNTLGFWYDVPMQPWAPQITEALASATAGRGIRWYVLLGDGIVPGGNLRRIEWLRAKLPLAAEHYRMNADPFNCVPEHEVPDTLLFHSSDKVCREWRESGGHAALFPGELPGDHAAWFRERLRTVLTQQRVERQQASDHEIERAVT